MRPPQDRAVTFCYERNRSIIHARPGGGKTCVGLTVLSEWLKEGVCKRAIVTAPLRVCELVWQQEAQKWEHLQHLNIAIATGTQKERDAAVDSGAEIVVVNHENILDFLYMHGRKFDALEFDELSKFKGPTSKRWQPVLKMIDHIKLRIGMTGSPAPLGIEDLFGQARIIDHSILGRSWGKWRNEHMMMTSELPVPLWAPRSDTFMKTLEALAPITFTLSPKDWRPPPIEYEQVSVTLPPALRELYERLQEDELLEVGPDLLVPGGKAQLQAKLQQLCAGFYYTNVDGEQTGRRLDFFRLDLVDDIVKLQRGDPICIVYDYVEQLDELRKRYPGAPVLGQKTTRKQAQDAYNRWNDGLLKQIIMHPASAGHGLNMQYGGHKLVRCSLPWSLDYFEQVPLRFAREGQTAAATKSWDLTARDTVEEHLYQLLVAKAHTQDGVFTWPGANT
jgi:hypothetical protein